MIGKADQRETPVLGATISRRGFVKTGGALFVSLALPLRFATRAEATENPTSIDPTSPASWLEIRSDNTIVARTGRTETGVGITGYYPQTIAEELNVRPEMINLIMWASRLRNWACPFRRSALLMASSRAAAKRSLTANWCKDNISS